MKKESFSFGKMLFCAAVVLALFFSVNVRKKAQAIGKEAGTTAGILAGRAVGSLEGFAVRQEAYQAGKEAGLSAEDTTAELSGRLKEVGKLQVLVASGTFSDVLSVGDEYAALVSMHYNASFTVDLSTAEISRKGDQLQILLDPPEVEFIPVGEIVKKNEYQKGNYSGSTEDGYDALNHSANRMKTEAEQKLIEDEEMQKAARASAQTQLTQLVNAVSLSPPEEVSVAYRI